jgi:phosphate transport system protein
MERHFEHELAELKNNLVSMGSLVDRQINAACNALFEGDTAMAEQVVRTDTGINDFDTLIDKQCQRIFALNQPVAIDLRLLMSALKINNDLERMGDIAVNIAERVEPLALHQKFLHSTRLSEMTQIARIMVKDSLDAFIGNNPDLATRVLESDDVVDALDGTIFRQVVAAIKTDSALIDPGSHILVLSRHIERLADHSTNIAEDVIFLVDAKIVKHNAFQEESGS